MPTPSTTASPDRSAQDNPEAYAARFALPVVTGIRVDGVSRSGDGYLVTAGEHRFVSDNVVVATGAHQTPHVPAFAADLDPAIRQLHSTAYRGPAQLQDGAVLLVGAGNSGADIAPGGGPDAPDVARRPPPRQIPWRIERAAARPLNRLAFWAFAHVLTVRTPVGRALRPRVLRHSGPLVRVKARRPRGRRRRACRSCHRRR
ncbi:MAG TPA: NAD(P)-binding domain-containing protein [Euzebyales bacterium]|nr:NAD(P)-binding domain-containing protein [Euzebyales bacterium]